MLVNCPRCGFSQPNDQYCAQCGVDMQSFKPKEQPVINRIFGNAGVQIGILLIAAVFVGQSIFHSQQPQSWVQKITHFHGISKSEKTATSSTSTPDEALTNEAGATTEEVSSLVTTQSESLSNQELSNSRDGDPATNAAGTPLSASAVKSILTGAQDLSSVNFKVTYAEITREMLTKWITDSSNLGLYQNLEKYSAGILYDFKKRGDNYHQLLKSSDLRLNAGSANSNLSGIMTEDGTQMLGLAAAIEYKSNENEIIHGNIIITRSSPNTNEAYPAEFALPKGAVFFIIGVLKQDFPAPERTKLNMPPFQIFKSPDFMTRKTEFVIILEPDYK